jgi:hypothetical protein
MHLSLVILQKLVQKVHQNQEQQHQEDIHEVKYSHSFWDFKANINEYILVDDFVIPLCKIEYLNIYFIHIELIFQDLYFLK